MSTDCSTAMSGASAVTVLGIPGPTQRPKSGSKKTPRTPGNRAEAGSGRDARAPFVPGRGSLRPPQRPAPLLGPAALATDRRSPDCAPVCLRLGGGQSPGRRTLLSGPALGGRRGHVALSGAHRGSLPPPILPAVARWSWLAPGVGSARPPTHATAAPAALQPRTQPGGASLGSSPRELPGQPALSLLGAGDPAAMPRPQKPTPTAKTGSINDLL